MALRFNTAQRNAGADGHTASFAGGVLEIRSGTQPASANDAATGTLLVSITLPNPAFAAAASGTASKNGAWSGTAAATGTAGWGRMRNSGDTLRMDGNVTATAGGGDYEIDDVNIVADGVVTVTSAELTQPAE